MNVIQSGQNTGGVYTGYLVCTCVFALVVMYSALWWASKVLYVVYTVYIHMYNVLHNIYRCYGCSYVQCSTQHL